jgi:hypothetical protein
MRMGMSDRNHSVTAIHIQILLTCVIPEIGTLCARYGNIMNWVYVEEFHGISFSRKRKAFGDFYNVKKLNF